jgi:hypothetical protein
VERYPKTSIRTLFDPMLYSSILHVALVAAVFFTSLNYENSGTPVSEATTIEFNYVESTEPENAELYSAQTLPATDTADASSALQPEIDKNLSDFFEQEKLKQQRIEEEKVLALERERTEKERLERELFAQEQARQRQLEQDRQERRRYQQQLQADIDAAHRKRVADLKSLSSSPNPNRNVSSAYTGPHLRLARSRSQVIGVPLTSGGCPATIITHEMSFSWNADEVRDPYSQFTCTAEVGAASENTVIKNSSSSYDKNGCAPDSNRNSNNILKTYMTAPFMNRQCDNGCTGQLECKNGRWEVRNFQFNDRQWYNKLEKTKPKSNDQYY